MKSFFVFLLLISFVHAEEHHYRNDLSELELSNTQKKEMASILKEHRHNLQKLRDYKHDLDEKKENLFSKSVLNKDKIKDINNKINEYSTNIEINFLTKTHDLLSPKQRKKFEDYIEDWKIE